MSNMSYCRHENTLQDLRDVHEQWDEFEPSEATRREVEARAELRELILEMAEELLEVPA